MGYEIIFKIAGIGILTAVIGQILKNTAQNSGRSIWQILKNIGKDEMATITTLAGVVVVLMMAVNLISQLLDTVKNLFALY